MNKKKIILRFQPAYIYKGIGAFLLFFGTVHILIQDLVFLFIWLIFTILWTSYSFGLQRVIIIEQNHVEYNYTAFQRIEFFKKRVLFDVYSKGFVLLEEEPPVQSDIMTPAYFILLKGNEPFKIRILGDPKEITKNLSKLKKEGIKVTKEYRD